MDPRSSIKNINTPETVEDRILHASMKVFSENGYNGATTIKIAKDANVNEITIFRKFKSKENLLKAVVEKNITETLENLDNILCREKSTDIEICIKTLGISLKQFLDGRMDFILIVSNEGRKRPELKHTFSLFRSKMIEHLEEYFKTQIEHGNMRKVNPEVLAFTLFSFIFYKSISEKMFDDDLLLDDNDAFERYTDILIRGITQ